MQLMWFRNDLRCIDNVALQGAFERSDKIVAMYIYCPVQLVKHDVGHNRQWFHLRQLLLLQKQLQRYNIPLLYRECADFSEVPAMLQSLAATLAVENLWFNREYGAWELERDSEVRLAMAEQGIGVQSLDDGLILPADAIAQQSGQPYKVFTPFKKRWLARMEETHLPTFTCIAKSTAKVAVDLGADALKASLAALEHKVPESVKQAWALDMDGAHRQLQSFLTKQVKHYNDRRDQPSLSGTSRLSSYLASGVLSARSLYLHAAKAKPSEGRQTWISELIWRDFYRHVMIHFSAVSRNQPFNRDYSQLQWQENAEHYAAWQAGQTGVPLVDAGMRQLIKEGWMHNRVRMVVAMYLSKNLFLDWKLGERHFMQHLVDGDFASNNGGWQWSASVGTDAAPYFRIFNPLTQAERFDAEAEYIKQYVPELSQAPLKWVLKADKYQSELQGLGYCKMLVPLKESRQGAIDAFKRFKAL